METKIKVGITHGDVNGVSYELVIKMLAENKMTEICTPVFYGSPKVAAYYRKNLNVENFNLNNIQSPKEANTKRTNVINCVDDAIKVEPGRGSQEADASTMTALKLALEHMDNKQLSVLTAAPCNESAYKAEGDEYVTGFFSKRYGTEKIMQILVGEKMKIGFVTTNIPLKEIPTHLSISRILEKLKILDHALRVDFMIRKPRIAVLALNPSGGESCTFGEEEKNVIAPAIENARDSGIMALGPYAAENLFAGTDFEKFDAILALYHEQGMIPFKAIEGYTGASLLTGLPVVLTSTVHGVAYDIAGKGEADEAALRNAVYLGIDVYKNRMQHRELTRNPLQHYDIAGNSNETDLNVEQIAGIQKEHEE